MTRNTEHLSWVLSHMPDESRQALARFTDTNPHWRGAHWDDCLDVLLDSDSHLEYTEPLYEDEFLAAMGHHTSAVAVTLVWANKDFREKYTPEQRMITVRSTLSQNGFCQVMTAKRDGFIVKRFGQEAEVHFVACDKDGNLRERTLSGLLRNMNDDEYFVLDTRDERP